MAGNWQNQDNDKTPILLHPAKRKELFTEGQLLFNDELFFDAHAAWEKLWQIEQGRDRGFLQGIILIAAHLHHIKKGNWSGALSSALAAEEKLRVPPAHKFYLSYDLLPLKAALRYNLPILRHIDPTVPPPLPDAFIYPKLFENE